eukprot:CAMPEP_0115548176 /NCGR_PEP_ID=MMETSP0271-20121206/94030_1 /TAXON_ID=71861 /ORGANISM="Scrippsiella trochoidea, Strain CCMP3099" /LENGTH=72 /DNA_ID=CAMNT_0002981637 /DNA_START=279 /DNA_END=494 /DNA_ORIENTATION=-
MTRAKCETMCSSSAASKLDDRLFLARIISVCSGLQGLQALTCVLHHHSAFEDHSGREGDFALQCKALASDER